MYVCGGGRGNQNAKQDQSATVAKLRRELDDVRDSLLRKDDELREQMQEALLARDRAAKTTQQYSAGTSVVVDGKD